MNKLALVAVAASFLGLVACASEQGSSSDDGATESADISASAPITIKNWLNHPKIVAVRKEVAAVDALKLPPEKKELCQDSGVGEFERDKSTDASGKIRELVLELGGEDGARIETHYYDAKGTLRFVFATDNDVHGNSSEERTYFDETGAQLFQVNRFASDPENNNPDIAHAKYELPSSPDELEADAKDPAKMFDAAPRCDE